MTQKTDSLQIAVDDSFLCSLANAQVCHFDKGQYLIRQDDPMDCIYYLLKGSGELLEYTREGETLFCRLKSADQPLNRIVGLHNLWQLEPSYTYSFVAATDIDCLRIEAGQARQAFLDHPQVMDQVLVLLTEKYLNLRDMYKARQSRHIANQVCDYLFQHMQQNASGACLPRDVTNVRIARRLNVHQVTVAKIMRQLQTEGVLRRTPAGLQILDPARLQAYAQGQRLDYLKK